MTLQDEIRLLLEAPMMNTHDVRTQLRLDHDEVLQVARDMVDADGGESRRMLLRRLRPALLIHLQAVRQEVYASLRKLRSVRSAQVQMDERLADHQAVTAILAWLVKSRKTEYSEWASRAQSLLTLLRRHVDAEQDGVFALLGEHFDDAALARMAQSFRAAKTQLAMMDAKAFAPQKAEALIIAPPSNRRERRSGRASNDEYANGEYSLQA